MQLVCCLAIARQKGQLGNTTYVPRKSSSVFENVKRSAFHGTWKVTKLTNENP